MIQAFGHPKDSLHVLLVQLVSILRHGQPVPMSKRAGTFVTLRDVVQEVGSDAARYIFLTRRSDSHLDFDLDVAKEQSRENPVTTSNTPTPGSRACPARRNRGT